MENQEERNSMISGFFGACLGGAIGAASYILLGMISSVYALVGCMVTAYCTLRLYRKFGGERGTAGLVICSIAMAVTGFLGYALDWILTLKEAIPALNLWGATKGFFVDILGTWMFWRGMLFFYVFTAVCTWSLLFSAKRLRRED